MVSLAVVSPAAIVGPLAVVAPAIVGPPAVGSPAAIVAAVSPVVVADAGPIAGIVPAGKSSLRRPSGPSWVRIVHVSFALCRF